MLPELNTRLLASAPGREASVYLRQILNTSPNLHQLTETISNLIASGDIPASLYPIWATITDNPMVIAYGMRQSASTIVREHAIRAFSRRIRSSNTFAPMWTAIGGASGLSDIFSASSIHHVQELCGAMSRTTFAESGRKERREAFTQLLQLLHPLGLNQSRRTDLRPLLHLYARIIPACTFELAAQWLVEFREKEWWCNNEVTKKVVLAHAPAFESEFLNNPKTSICQIDIVCLLVSNNFSFGLEFLQHISTLSSLELDEFMGNPSSTGGTIIAKIIQPMSQTCHRRRVSLSERERFWKLVVDNAKKHEKIAAALRVRASNIKPPHSRESEASDFDATMLASLMEVMVDKNSMPKMGYWLIKSAPSLRLTISKLYLKHGARIDLNMRSSNATKEEANLKKTKFSKHNNSISVSATIFKLLPGLDALALYDVLAQIENANGKTFLEGPEGQRYDPRVFLPSPASIFVSSQSHIPDSRLHPQRESNLRAMLMQRVGSLVVEATGGSALQNQLKSDFEELQKKSIKEREPEKRAAWAIEALKIPVAMADVEMYNQGLIWARRYTKDPLAVKQIYSLKSFCTMEAIVLGSGMTFVPTQKENSREELKHHIEQCNAIFNTILGTMISALPEPSYYANDWSGVIQFIRESIGLRIRDAESLQTRLQLSDSDMAECIWKPTKAILIEMETLILSQEQEISYSSKGNGLISHASIKVTAPITLLFLDEVAEARNAIWAQYRARKDPEVLSLPEPFPRGLSMRDLLPNWQYYGPMPYMESRAKKVLFMDPEIAAQPIPVSKHQTDAIGYYIDHFDDTFRFYTGKKESPEWKRRVNEVWDYFMQHLSTIDSSVKRSTFGWLFYFGDPGVPWRRFKFNRLKKVHITQLKGVFLQSLQAPKMPKIDDIDAVMEWNPAEGLVLDTTRTSKPWTNLDLALESSGGNIPSLESNYIDTEIASTKNFWQNIPKARSQYQHDSRDATVLASLLTIQTRHGSGDSILKSAFPTGQNQNQSSRFPPAYLDQDFLESLKNTPVTKPHEFLDKFRDSIPPVLLKSLAVSLLKRITTEPSKPLTQDVVQSCVKLIRILSRSSNPSLAKPLVMQFIIELSDMSAWHRQVLSPGFLNRLEPSEVKDFMLQFSRSLLEKNSKAASVTAEGNTEANQTTVAVKTSTVKMLAQLLNQCSYLDFQSTLDILEDMIRNTRQKDVRITVIDAITSLATTTTEVSIMTRILSLIENVVVPIAGSLDEEDVNSDRSLIEAETNGGKIPTPYSERSGEPRIMNSVIGLLSLNTVETTRLVQKAIELSIDTNKRWARLILKENNLVFDVEQLPASTLYHPTIEKVLGVLMANKSHGKSAAISTEMFQLFTNAVIMRTNPPKELTQLCENIYDKKAKRMDEHKEHWRRCFGDYKYTENLPSDKVRKVADSIIKNVKDNSATSSHLPQSSATELLSTYAEAIIQGNHGHQAVLNYLKQLTTSMASKNIAEDIVKSTIQYIDSLRTEEWMQDNNRYPSQLPRTLPFYGLLLAAKMRSMTRKTKEEESEQFGNDVVQYIRWMFDDPQDIYQDQSDLATALGHCSSGTNVHWLPIVGKIQNLDSPDQPTLIDRTRVRIASKFCDDRHEYLGTTWHSKSELRYMVREWKASKIEGFRNDARVAFAKCFPEKDVEENVEEDVEEDAATEDWSAAAAP